MILLFFVFYTFLHFCLWLYSILKYQPEICPEEGWLWVTTCVGGCKQVSIMIVIFDGFGIYT